MKAICCCGARRTVRLSLAGEGDGRGRGWLKTAGTSLAGAIAILLPKCPLCIAAWVAASTGIALPAMVAGSVRPLLVIACALSAALLVYSAVGRRRMRRSGRLGAPR